jgi:hypothetical protein
LRHSAALVVVGVLIAVRPSYAQDDRLLLGDILAGCGCLVPGMPASLLDKPVADYKQLLDEQGFVIAFRMSPANDADVVDVVAGNAAAGRWKHVQLPVERESTEPRQLAGAVWSVRRAPPYTLVGLRVAIDGIATSILSADLTRVGATYGVVHGVLPNGLVLYEPAQRHFAPTHYVRLTVLELASGLEREVYPVKPYDRVRRDMIRRERARYTSLGARWCRESGHHCDPELFDSAIPGSERAIVNEMTKAVSLRVVYGDGDGVIVVCTGLQRLDAIVCHETATREWRRLFPKEDVTQLLRRATADPARVRP